MSDLDMFVRQVKSRSAEHRLAMRSLAELGLAGQMAAILRQELDSMTRVIYLLAQGPGRRSELISASVNGQRWKKPNSKAPITDKIMVDLAQDLQGWTQSVYKLGCAFIHLSSFHDYDQRDPLDQLSPEERTDVLEHCRSYHRGPKGDTFADLVPFLPLVLTKVADNLEYYLEQLESGEVTKPGEI